MKERPKASAKGRPIVDPALEKPLLRLHAARDIDSLWKAIQQTIDALLPACFIGLTLQHNPILPRVVRSTKTMSDSFFPITPIENYFAVNPGRRLVLASDVFPNERQLMKSIFYRNYLAPANGRYAIGLFFWNARRLLGVIVIMRNAKQGAFSRSEIKLIRQLYAQFRTALDRLRSSERERAVRVALEKFMRRVLLPTILLRWSLNPPSEDQQATNVFELRQRGPCGARF